MFNHVVSPYDSSQHAAFLYSADLKMVPKVYHLFK